MSDLDGMETNFRLSLISQRETNAELRHLSKKAAGIACQTQQLTEQMQKMTVPMASLSKGLGEVAGGLASVADRGEQTAERLEDSIEVMRSFAEGQVEIPNDPGRVRPPPGRPGGQASLLSAGLPPHGIVVSAMARLCRSVFKARTCYGRVSPL